MPRTAPRTSLAALAAVSALLLAACGGHDKPKAAPTPTPTTSTTSVAPKPKPKPVAAPRTCPLTGKALAKGQNRNRPALAVKIDNVDIARPQSGIDHADVIFEETVEGGLTRLFAVFHCSSAATIGPVRSARTTDSDLIRLLRSAVFGYSGANSRVNARINATKGAVPLSYDANGGLYHRSSGRPAPHNVYTSTMRLVTAGKARHKNLRPPRPLFAYAVKPAHGKVVRSISLRWSGYASAAWSWNGKVWNRSQNGSRDMLTDGHRVAVNNVVVMRIKTRFLGLRDVLGNASPDDVITGKGRAWVFRNGRVLQGSWRHKYPGSRLKLVNHGHLIKLAPGHTWVELLPAPGTLSYSRH
ncbi:MAG TPA: DUF3048 domain-containing protein [Mycobacteriales bacterium]|nr:DUF3048 domain-containing protein [Mycobacteriales bacterium]